MNLRFSIFLFALSAVFCGQAQAVDLTNRLGVGYSQQLGSVDDLPMVTVHYFVSSQVALTGAIGVDTKDDESKFGALFKIRRVIFTEKQMNFYMAGSLAATSHEEGTPPDDKSNVEIGALLGGEFFFAGLDSLAFYFETGIGVITGDGGSRFRTIGDHPLRAGMTFYF